MRVEVAGVAALVVAVAGPLAAQETPQPDGGVPEGPLLVEVGTSWTDGISALPAAYLDGLTLRSVDTGHSLTSGRRFSVRVGLRMSDHWIVQAERAWIDAEFGLANVEVPVREWGGSLQYLLPGGFYVLGGAGTVRYAPEDGPKNTDVRWTAGAGGWFRLSDRLSLRTEVRDDMSLFSLGSVEGGLQHRISAGGAVVVSLP